MLKEFYDFIAKRINRYFLELSAEGALQKGESFCLKLDDSDTVQAVSDAIKELATRENNCGEYEYQCMDGSVYRTFTLQVIDNEIIIAAQINDMTNDFLCATLRNAANVEYSCAATPQIRQTGNRLSGLAETAYASLLAQCFV